MNKLFFVFIFLFFCLTSFAQVKNYAVAFDGNSDINFKNIPELNNLPNNHKDVYEMKIKHK